MRILLLLVITALVSCRSNPPSANSSGDSPRATNTKVQTKEIKENSAAQIKKPYVLMVSIDGFRHDYIEKYGAKEMARIEEDGRRAVGLIPAYPTKTFPNHYSIVTGMYPTRHGIVDNNFYDSTLNRSYSLGDPKAVRESVWYQGEPIWVAAEKAGMISASYFWVGSEAEIEGVRPTYYMNYDSKIDNSQRVQQVLSWLSMPESTRPHFVTLYFSNVDDAGHGFGPNSNEVGIQVKEIDRVIGELDRGLSKLDIHVNLFIVSDHGMAELDPKKVIDLTKIIEMSKFQVSGGGTYASLFSKNSADLADAYEKLKKVSHISVYHKNKLPKRLKFVVDSPRVGEIVLKADMPWYMMTKPVLDPAHPFTIAGNHGWDNRERDMWGIFLAKGPNILKGPRIKQFENVNIYAMVMNILGLESKVVNDSDPKVLKNIYRINAE